MGAQNAPEREIIKALADERIIVGACLRWPEVTLDLRTRLSSVDFYPGKNREAFEAIEKVSNRAEPSILTSVAAELPGNNGGADAAYLVWCASEAVTPTHLEYHALNVIRAAQRRRLREAGQVVSLAAVNDQMTADEAIARAQEIVAGVQTASQRTPVVLSPTDQGDLAALLVSGEGGDQTLSYGLYDLDKKTNGGVRPGEMVVIGGRTGMGKSALLRLMAHSFGRQGNVLFASNEMTNEQLIQRDLSVFASVPLEAVVSRRLSDSQVESLQFAEAEIAASRVYTLSSWSMTSASLRVTARELHTRLGLVAVVVDYLQKMDDPGKTDLERVGHATRELKALALELGLPVVVGAQLSREGEQDEGSKQRPTLTDLRSSGEIEQTADVVLLLFRENARYHVGKGVGENVAEIIIAKQRQGDAGTMVKVAWIPSLATFRNLAY